MKKHIKRKMCIQKRSELCKNCGKCCKELFSKEQYKPYAPWTKKEFIDDWKSEFKPSDRKKVVRPWYSKSRKCPFLTAKGCILPPCSRPKICNSFLCKEAKVYNKKKKQAKK